MKYKLINAIGFLVLGAIVFGFLGVIIGALLPGGDASTVGEWATLPGAVVGAIYGATRKQSLNDQAGR